MIFYTKPQDWLLYDTLAVSQSLTNAKAALSTLAALPHQRSWGEPLRKAQRKREIAGTTKMEGADFSEQELKNALAGHLGEHPTRSQKQAAALVRAERWSRALPDDRAVDREVVLGAHSQIVQGADEDRCAPGELRRQRQNVTFGTPRHTGVEGGFPCEDAFAELCAAAAGSYLEHDELIQALAFHYHLAAMHPFLDGNGRVSRVMESLFLKRAGLGGQVIAMSHYYNEEKQSYFQSMAEVRAKSHDLTPFLIFGLAGIERQCRRLSAEMIEEVRKVLFRDTMHELFGRLQTPRKRAVADRQVELLKLLLESGKTLEGLIRETAIHYKDLRKPLDALIRDVGDLLDLGAIQMDESGDDRWLSTRLDWPTEVTVGEFLEKFGATPKSKVGRLLSV